MNIPNNFRMGYNSVYSKQNKQIKKAEDQNAPVQTNISNTVSFGSNPF